MTRRGRSPLEPPAAPAPLPAWAALCFVASGVAGLLYESVWAKQLSYLLGNSLHAVAAVVAAFLAGLALGARFLGPALSRRWEGARAYAVLELAIAALGVASLPLLRGLEPVVGLLVRALGAEGPVFAVARLALLFAALAAPAALMGATLPVLVERFEGARAGPALARLYALNTLGAVAGVVAGGFLLIPTLGLQATAAVAAALNAGAALVAWLARGPVARRAAAPPAIGPAAGSLPGRAGRQLAPSATPPAVEPREEEPLAGPERAAFGALLVLAGAAALAFQIVWVRVFTLVFGSSVYSFAGVLAVYLLGLALGSAAIAPRLARGAGLAAFGLLQLGLAAAAAAQLLGYARLPQAMRALTVAAGDRWAALLAGEAALIALFLIVPCALLGAGFPLAARLLQRGGAGGAAGSAYALNTLGTIGGSLAAGFLAIPAWGVQATHVAACCLAAAGGVLAMALATRRGEPCGRPRLAAAGLLAAIGALLAAAPRWDPSLMSVGLYRPIQAHHLFRPREPGRAAEIDVAAASRHERVLYYREGLNGSVLVGTDATGSQRWLRVGGKIDAGTGRDMETQVLLGLIPAAMAPRGARTLVIGLGSGFTAAAALAAGAGATDVVELEPRVVEASRFFHQPGRHPLDDPRVRLVVGDARTHLAHGTGRYDVVVSEPSNPWLAGVNNLFTVDFYRLARARLEPGGVFCQWLQLYELSPETLGSLLASFLEVFPEGYAFTAGQRTDLILVAAPATARLDLERLGSPASRALLAAAAIPAPESLAGSYAGTFEALAPLAAGAPLNRDDLPHVEYRAPRDLVAVGRSGALDGRGLAATGPPAGPLFADWPPERWFEARVRLLVAHGDLDAARAAAAAAAGRVPPPAAARLAGEVEAAERRRRAAGEAERARQLIDTGRGAEGLAALERAAAIDPLDGRIWLWIADRRRVARDWAGAESTLARGRALGGDALLADAAVIGGMIEVDRGRPRAAAQRFREAQRRDPDRSDGYLFEACALAAAGDAAGARAALRRGLRRLPGAADLTRLLASLDEAPAGGPVAGGEP